MIDYEYRVLPAPRRGLKGKGVKGAEARFSNALQGLMNEQAADGWSYLRAETLPSEERSGITSHNTVWRHVLVFRRPRGGEETAEATQEQEMVNPLLLEVDMPEDAYATAQDFDDDDIYDADPGYSDSGDDRSSHDLDEPADIDPPAPWDERGR